MKRILFVDDEPNVLQGLQRMLRPLRHEWDSTFVDSGPAALAALGQSPFDVVVSDMRMPGMNGAQLLAAVRAEHPHVVRLILSGQSDQDQIFHLVGSAHQYLSKPCDAAVLKETISRACALRDLLRDPGLAGIVTQLGAVPNLPSHRAQLAGVLQSQEPSIEAAGRIIARDMGLSAKILQMVHSSFFGSPPHICDPLRATTALGLQTVTSVALSSDLFSDFPVARVEAMGLQDLWRHSQTAATVAERIAQTEGLSRERADEVRLAAFLHDVGRLVLAFHCPAQYEQVNTLARQKDLRIWEAETEVFGSSHAKVGGYLLGLWGLPSSLVDAVAWHHRPQDYSGSAGDALEIVCAADVLARECCLADGPNAGPWPLEDHSGENTHNEPDPVVEFVSGQRLAQWRQMCRQECIGDLGGGNE